MTIHIHILSEYKCYFLEIKYQELPVYFYLKLSNSSNSIKKKFILLTIMHEGLTDFSPSFIAIMMTIVAILLGR